MTDVLLSACMIVKNEEWTIRKCLDSLTDVVDEIIVVDTGSTDQTIPIAKSYGAKIYPYSWDDNFGKARNESLRHAQGDFVLIIDADEYLDPVQKSGLRSFLQETDAGGVLVTVRNYVGSLSRISNAIPVSIVRIFRRGYFYTGAIHEQVVASIIETGKTIEKLALTFHHVGYLDEFISTREKTHRNISLLKEELDKDPNDIFHRSNLMAEYVRIKDFENCRRLAEETLADIKKTPVETWSHLVARTLIFLIMSSWETGDRKTALSVAKEATEYFPALTDVWKRYGNILLETDDLARAVDVLMECRRLGDPKDTLIDTIAGMGTYFAAADLGDAWAKLGDDSQALKWFLTSFFENPRMEYVVFPLLYLLKLKPEDLQENVESRIEDWATAGNYAEMYAVMGHDGAEDVLERVEKRFGESVVTQRAHMALIRRRSIDDLRRVVEENPTEHHLLLLGISLLNDGQEDLGLDALKRAGDLGAGLREAYEKYKIQESLQWKVTPFIRDLVAMHADRLLVTLLPYAIDRKSVWIYLKYSPLKDVLIQIEWPGESGYECEQNAIRLFQQKRWLDSAEWLERAMQYPPTITKVLVESDLALVHSNVEHALKVLKFGMRYFPDSQLLKNAWTQLTGDGSAESEANLISPREEVAEGMNVADYYRTNSILTMPLNVQLSQLHGRGGMLTKRIFEQAQAGRINDMRKDIEEMQNIITFLRSSLDPNLEVSAITDKTYAYFYNLTVKWFLHPASVAEDYAPMVEFWESWEQTWRKVSMNRSVVESRD